MHQAMEKSTQAIKVTSTHAIDIQLDDVHGLSGAPEVAFMQVPPFHLEKGLTPPYGKHSPRMTSFGEEGSKGLVTPQSSMI